MKKLIVVTLAALTLSACGYNGGYRYPCQDPVNWENKECKPPVCKVDGACTSDLLGFDPTAETTTTVDPTSTGETIAP